MPREKILVTGGTGYIGSHTVVELLNNGYDVISIDNLSNSNADVNERIETICGRKPIFFQIDVCDSEKLISVFKQHPDISGIIHFAAYKSVGESVKDPLKYYHNNLFSLINLLECSTRSNIRNLVFSSSCTVYGQPETMPVNEQTPLLPPSSPYGSTKQICEKILRDYCTVHQENNCILLRYFNPIGAHSSGIIGELPIGIPNNLLPFITQTAYGIREQLQIFGGDYNTPDGTAIRDFLHVCDLAEAHVAAIKRFSERKQKENCETFNLGTGEGYSVLQTVKIFEKINNVKVNYNITNRRSGDIEQIWADCSLANRELGWKAKRNLQDMVRDAWNWELYYRQHIEQTS